MRPKLKVNKTISIKPSAPSILRAITDSASIKQILFGCDIITDRIPGNKIIFKGNWNGTEFEDKGTILSFEAGKFYSYEYWSNFSGLSDVPENYSIIKFQLEGDETSTISTLVQENIAKKAAQERSDRKWKETLINLKSRPYEEE